MKDEPASGVPDFRANSTGFLRLAAALLVIVCHSYALGGVGLDPVQRISSYASLGSLSVGVFFTISGLLVANSYAHSPSPWRYLWHRAVRILPGYWTALLVMAFVFGPLICLAEYGTVHGYLSLHPLAFVQANLWSNGSDDITPLLAHVPHPYDLSGQLWSIPYEVKCYLVLGVFGMAGLLRRVPMVLIAVLIWGYMVYQHLVYPLSPLNEAYDVITCFALGACLYCSRELVPLRGRYALLAAGALVPALAFPYGYTLLPFALVYLVYWLAYCLPAWTRRVNVKTDLSYGTYLYGLPMGQLLAVLHLYRLGYAPYTLATVALTLGCAWLSWRSIEAPALQFKGLAIPMRTASRLGEADKMLAGPL